MRLARSARTGVGAGAGVGALTRWGFADKTDADNDVIPILGFLDPNMGV